MFRKLSLCLTCIFLSVAAVAQAQKPRLVVGLVVDQMRWDFLYRYADRYTATGFKRLLGEGFSCENAFIPFTPTYTGAGHTSVYTGSVPALNGIIGNDWYDRRLKRTVYCTEDLTVTGVGSSSPAGKMSPRNMWSSSIADEMRLASNMRSKTIAIALKDRGAILPGGHSANAAYWFDNTVGAWISSTYYMQQLPEWVVKFNERKLPDQYLKQNWHTLYPISSYKQSTADSNRYENKLPGEDHTFPHITENLTTTRYSAFVQTPFANTYTLEMAKAALRAEKLGKGAETDMLAISLSSPDYAGHTFGPNAIELEDMYLRLDRDISDFLKFLDAEVGKGQYLLFLTADHGAAHNPLFMQDHKMSGGVFNYTSADRSLKDSLQAMYGVNGIIEYSINKQIYLNDSLIAANRLNKTAISDYIKSYFQKFHEVSHVVDLSQKVEIPEKLKFMIGNGYNQKLSGDIQIVLKPQYIQNWSLGTTHGAWNPFDAHIPLVWFGWQVKKGKSYREVYMSDIAPTIAAMLRIQMPSASVGTVISEMIK